jgi:hypothetical protein
MILSFALLNHGKVNTSLLGIGIYFSIGILKTMFNNIMIDMCMGRVCVERSCRVGRLKI